MSARWDGEPGANTRALTPPEAAVKLPYAHQQAAAFIGALMFFGALAGALVAAIKGGLR